MVFRTFLRFPRAGRAIYQNRPSYATISPLRAWSEECLNSNNFGQHLYLRFFIGRGLSSLRYALQPYRNIAYMVTKADRKKPPIPAGSIPSFYLLLMYYTCKSSSSTEAKKSGLKSIVQEQFKAMTHAPRDKYPWYSLLEKTL